MNPKQKKITIFLWGLVVLALVGIVVGKILLPRQSIQSQRLSSLFPVTDIALIDQEGNPFSTAQLYGQPWVADFVFTSCPGTCPLLSRNMVEVQKSTPSVVGLVSFTVDPATDTPAILKGYGAALHADFSRWHFLTGTREQMAQAAIAMKVAVRPADKEYALTHSDRLLLVDPNGQVVGIYDGTKPEDVTRLIGDARKLAKATEDRS